APKPKAKAKKTAKPAKRAAARAEPRSKALAPGYQWANPIFAVRNPDAAIDFYKKAFGMVERFIMRGPGGVLMHAELQHKTAVIMIGPEMPERDSRAAASFGGSAMAVYLYVDSVDATAGAVTAAGGKVVEAPADMFWGDRVSRVVDPEGYTWWLATHVKDVA